GSAEAAAKLREAVRETAAALAAVDFYRFGPLAEQGRREKLAFWPDPRGTVARQLRQLTASADVNVLEEGAIARQSAALQGLPALELLVADEAVPLGPSPQAQFRCRLADAISGNIATLSQDVLQGWTAPDGMRARMLSAGPGNAMYKTHAEAAAEFVKSLLTGLQAVAEQQLKPRLDGKGPGSKGPYGKLGLERDVYASAVQSLRDLYGLLDFEANLARDKAWMKNWAKGSWRAMAMSDGMGGPGKDTPAADAPAMKEVVSRIGGMRMLIGWEMASASGIAIGFNELDGD
nr:imelysin family protein [Hyphomonas sp.]